MSLTIFVFRTRRKKLSGLLNTVNVLTLTFFLFCIFFLRIQAVLACLSRFATPPTPPTKRNACFSGFANGVRELSSTSHPHAVLWCGVRTLAEDAMMHLSHALGAAKVLGFPCPGAHTLSTAPPKTHTPSICGLRLEPHQCCLKWQ